jgi:hypothetical protein
MFPTKPVDAVRALRRIDDNARFSFDGTYGTATTWSMANGTMTSWIGDSADHPHEKYQWEITFRAGAAPTSWDGRALFAAEDVVRTYKHTWMTDEAMYL